MAGSFNAGSVNAKITFDDSEFEEAIKDLKKKTQELSNQVQANSETTANAIENVVNMTNKLKDGQQQLYGVTTNTSNSIKEEAENIKKLSQEQKKNVTETDRLAKANDKLNKSFKQTKLMSSDLQKSFTNDLHKMINEAEKTFAGKGVALKPIFDEMHKQYGGFFKNMKDFQRAWTSTLRDIGAYNKQVFGNLKAGFNGFNLIEISGLLSAEEVKKGLEGIVETTEQVAQSTEKATEANQKNIESTKQRIAINKQLVTSMEHLNPKQMEELYNFLSPMADTKLSKGKVSLSFLKREFADFAEGVKDFDTVLSNSLHMLGAYTEKIGTKKLHNADNALFNLTQLRKPIMEVTEEVENLTTAEKQLEIQAKETSEALQTKTITNDIKQLSEETKYTAEQVKILNDLFEKGTFRKNSKLIGGTPHTTAPFSKLYDYLENEYLSVLTKFDPEKHNKSKFRKQFQARLKPLMDILGFELTSEKYPSGKVGEYFPTKNFAGKRVGTYDAKNLISEEEFKQLIGETNALAGANESLATTVTDVVKANGNLIEVNQVITASNEHSLSVLRKLIENYAELGVLQKAMLQHINGVNILDKVENSYDNYKSKDNLVKSLNQAYGMGLKTVATTLDPDFYIFQNLELAIEGITPLIWDYKTLIELTDGTTLTFKDATLKLSESLEKEDSEVVKVTKDTEKLNTELSATQKFINGLKEAHYGFGFIGEDAKDARYIRNTLRALLDPTGSSKIVPKNKDIRKYNNYQKDFLYKFYDTIQRLHIPNITNHVPSALKIPTEKELGSRLGVSYPFENQYLQYYYDTIDGYKRFVKDNQTEIIGLLKDLNVSISTELSSTGKRIRVWNEELGKFQNIGSLDISNILDLGSIDDFQRIIDKATIYDESLLDVAESIKQVGASAEQLDKTEIGAIETTEKLTEKTKQLGEASEHTATQIKILEDIYRQAQMATFKSQFTYLNLENKYDKELTGMSMGAVISPEKLRERIKRELKPLFTELGIGFEARGRGEVPLLNIDNLISEEEFNRLIGKTEELGAEIDKTALKTTKLTYALKSTLTEFLDTTNIVRWGTEKEFKQAMKSFGDLMNGVMPLVDVSKELTAETEKHTNSLKQDVKETNKAVEANKELLASLKEVDLEAQLIANRALYSYLHSYTRKNYSPLYEYAKDTVAIHTPYSISDDKNIKLFENAFNAVNAKVEEIDGELRVNVENLKKPILDIIDLENQLAQSSDKVITAKKHEAEEFKKYTLFELELMENINRSAKYYTAGESSFLVPLDHWKNSGHKAEEYRNYTSILNSIKRNANWINRGRKKENIFQPSGSMLLRDNEKYKDMDTAEYVQSRLKDLLHDLNISISDITDKEFKKIRSKLSGKMVEYLDISELTPEVIEANEKWINKVKEQLIDLKRFEKEYDNICQRWHRTSEYSLKEFKKYMDRVSEANYIKYGREGNPFINDFIRDKNVMEFYNKALNIPHGYYELNFGDDPRYISNKIRQGLILLEKELDTTSQKVINLKQALTTLSKTRMGISKDDFKLAYFENDEILGRQLIEFPIRLRFIDDALLETATSAEQLDVDLKKLNESLNVINRVRIGDNWTVTLKSTGQAVKETLVTLDNFASSVDKVKEKEKELETGTNAVGESAKKTATEITQLVNAVKPISTSVLGGKISYDGIKRFTGLTFKVAITQANQLKNAINQVGVTAQQTAEEIERLPMVIEQVSSSSEKAGKTASESFKNARAESKKFHEEASKDSEKFYREQQERWRRYRQEQTRRYYNENFGMSDFSLKGYKNKFQQLNAIDARLEELYGRPFNSRYLRMPKMSGEYNAVTFGKNIAHTTTALKTFDNTVLKTAFDIHNQLITAMKQLYEANLKAEEPLTLPLNNWREALSEIKAFEIRYEQLMRSMYNLSRGLGANRNAGKKNTGYGALLESLGMTIGAGDNVINMADALSSEGSLGRLNVVGYSDYVANITEIVAKLRELKAEQVKADEGLTKYQQSLLKLSEAIKVTNNSLNGFVGKSEDVVKVLTHMAEANEMYARTSVIHSSSPLQGTSGLVKTLEHFSSLSGKNKQSLKGLTDQAKFLDIQLNAVKEEFAQGSITQETYNRELIRITESYKKLQATVSKEIRELTLPKDLEKTNSELKKGKQSLNEFGKEMGKQEQYVDNLYRGLQKARSLIISMKTILRMMGGMAVWNFAFELVESAKETYVAKNEMESLLNKNSKINTAGVDTFNRALDETVARFQKINKYSLGETASSIGLEFNLNAQEMAKSLPVIAMIQSEYVRAGRTVEEAGLAVKDILQGEFMRLSRETGVGKKELVEAGWSGDNRDVISLMEALDKVGKARHWDLFAEKATSLNDVLTITKSRFSELGAEIGTHSEPLIVGAFNTILGTIDSLKKGFEGLGSFGKSAVSVGGVVAGVITLSSLYLSLAKNMGLLDIATIGWTKSLASSVLQLNKSDVALHGFTKTLLATISGTEASTVANVGLSKSLAGRILGLNQNIIAEKGFGKAMTASILKSKEGIDVVKELAYAEEVKSVAVKEGINTDKISILTRDKSRIITSNLANLELSRTQRLAYMTTNLKYAEVAELSRGQAILKTITSWRLLRTAMLGVMTVGIIAWYASVSQWADTVKKNIEGLNTVMDNGDQMLKSAQETEQNYSNQLQNLTKDTKEYAVAQKNLAQAHNNVQDIKKANMWAGIYKERNKQIEQGIKLRHQQQMAMSYERAGVDTTQASEMASGWERRVKWGEQNWVDSMVRYNDRLYKANQHINEHIDLMKEANVSEEQRLKYIDEYNMKATEVADNWRKFNQGNVTAGASALLGEFQLAWIDLWNDTHFLNFWDSVQKTWKSVLPTLQALSKGLGDLGHLLLDFFATDAGQIVGGIAVVGTAFGVIGTKIYHLLGGAKSTIDILKSLKDRLKGVGDLWKDAGEKAEEANEKMGGNKKKTPKTTPEGTVPPTNSEYRYKDWGEWRSDVKQDFMGNARNFLKYATQIAEAMVLVTEAILLLEIPMWGLAKVGEHFKNYEPNIRKGIDGLKLIAPVMAMLLPPVVALMVIMDKYGQTITWERMGDAFLKSFVGIAMGIGLIAEAIAMLNAPLMALGSLGGNYSGMESNVRKGAEAMKVVSDSLIYLLPFVPALVGGLLLGIAIFESGLLGVGLTIAVVAGIATGMLLVAEAIIMLHAPLYAIANIGSTYKDLGNVRQGAEAMKVCAEAMGYVESALAKMVGIQWEDIKSHILSLTGIDIGTSLTDLTKEGGFLPKVNEFIKQLNEMEIISPTSEKIEALNGIAEGMGTIGDAVKNAKTAIDNLPTELKDGGTDNLLTGYDSKTGQKVPTDNDTNYFDQLKEPLEELGTFINWFNTELKFPTDGVDTDKLDTISQSADMVAKINDAVNKVKETMGNIAWGNVNTNFAQTTGFGGGLGSLAVLNPLASLGVGIASDSGSGDYQSSLGNQLHEMELVINDLAKFSSNISTASNGGGAFGEGANVDALTQMVTTVSDAITKLNDTLAQAVPQIKQNATNIGTGIKEGIKTGMGSLDGIVVTPLVAELGKAKANAATYGKGIGWALSSNYKSELKIKSATETEISGTLTYLEGKKQDFYNKGHDLGDSLSKGYKDGQDMHSPGIIARSTEEELGRVGTYFDEAIFALPQKAVELGENISSNFNPQLAMGGLSADELTDFQSGLDTISSMSSTTSLQTSTDFTNMSTSVSSNMANISTNVGGTFNTINQNATTSYAQLTNTTRTALNNMQSQTTKNIQGIKSSWRDMQTALIQSAENIRSETGSKIKSLESNMASFWNKVQNPANLLGGAGNPFAAQHSIRRRTSPVKSSIGFAGSGTNMGISSRFKSQRSKTDPSIFAKLFEIIGSDFPMYAGGGWSFNWSDDIRRTLLQWRTHFGEIYDNHLTVGKFENDDFPVRGIAEIAKNYIYDAISRTHYVGYFDSRYGDDPLAAWNAGGFNCWDGTNVVLALASAFGFSGSRVHGSWDGVPHVWARIPGLGDIDATAIQQGYGFTASKVRGAGSVSPAYTNPDSGTTNNYNGDINIHIHTDGNDVEVDDRKIDSETGRKIIDLLGINPSTGR